MMRDDPSTAPRLDDLLVNRHRKYCRWFLRLVSISTAEYGSITTATAFHWASRSMAAMAFIVSFNQRLRTTVRVMIVGRRILIFGRLMVVIVVDFGRRGSHWRRKNTLAA